MSASDWPHCWWLRPGEVAASPFLDGRPVPLVFESDDGTLWEFRFGKERVIWDHESQSLVQGTGDDATDSALREILERLGWLRESWALARDEQAILDEIVRAQRTGDNISLRKLRQQIRPTLDVEIERLRAMTRRLEPRFVEEDEGDRGFLYLPTFAGLLRSCEAAFVKRVVEAAIAVLRGKYDDDADFRGYTLDDVVDAGGFEDAERQFIDRIIVVSRLFRGGNGTIEAGLIRRNYGVPDDIDALADCDGFAAFMSVTRTGMDSPRCWPTAARRLGVAAGRTERDVFVRSEPASDRTHMERPTELDERNGGPGIRATSDSKTEACSPIVARGTVASVPTATLERQRAFTARQSTPRELVLHLRPFLEALRREPRIAANMDDLRREARAHRDAIATHDATAVKRLVELGNDFRSVFPPSDPPTPPGEPIRPWYWSRFDACAKESLSIDPFERPDRQRDPTVASKLLQFLEGKLKGVVSLAERTGDETQLERSAPLWARFNEEQRVHAHAVREFYIQEQTHAGASLRRLEHIVRLLNYLPTPEELAAADGLDFTDWQPVARAVNYVAFGRKPDPPLHFDYEKEGAELFEAVRKDVDRLCEEIHLRLTTTNPATSSPATSPLHAQRDDDPSPFDECSLEGIERSLPIDALLMTAVPVELRAVRRRLNPLPGFERVVRVPCEESTYYLGRIGRYSCAVTMSDAGSVGRSGAALTLHDAVARLRPAFVLAVGIAFGRDSAIQALGDVLIATAVIPYEAQRVQAAGRIARAPHPEAGMVLLNRLRALDAEDVSALRLRFGPLLSGEKLVDDAMFKAQLFADHPTAIGGEMEAAGIYAAAARKRVEWAVIKGICDWADGTKNDDHQASAAKNAADVVELLLNRQGLDRRAFGVSLSERA